MPYGISSIAVRSLFGRFDYDLPIPQASTADLSRMLILYGDNGSGKTTLLRLLFHLLSPAPRRGHRTFLAQVAFRSFQVTFSTGFSICAQRTGDSVLGAYELKLLKRGDVVGRAKVQVNDENVVPPIDEPELDTLCETISQEHELDLYYLGDDRTFETDIIPRHYSPTERSFAYDEDETFDVEVYHNHIGQQRIVRRPRGQVADLTLAIDRASSSIRRQVLGASNIGGESTNAIYTEVLRRIAQPGVIDTPGVAPTKSDMIERVSLLSSRTELFQRFGLVPALRDDPILDSIRCVPEERWDIMLGVLTPFLDGLEARLDALGEIAGSIAAFVDNMNAFYHDKKVSFTLQRGITVETLAGEGLTPSSLSSGERHLLLLLTNLLYARERRGLFIIDEPELSLNMKWQRRLVSALLDCSRASGTLFVLASHSFELIASADERVIHLSQPLPQRLPML